MATSAACAEGGACGCGCVLTQVAPWHNQTTVLAPSWKQQVVFGMPPDQTTADPAGWHAPPPRARLGLSSLQGRRPYHEDAVGIRCYAWETEDMGEAPSPWTPCAVRCENLVLVLCDGHGNDLTSTAVVRALPSRVEDASMTALTSTPPGSPPRTPGSNGSKPPPDAGPGVPVSPLTMHDPWQAPPSPVSNQTSASSLSRDSLSQDDNSAPTDPPRTGLGPVRVSWWQPPGQDAGVCVRCADRTVVAPTLSARGSEPRTGASDRLRGRLAGRAGRSFGGALSEAAWRDMFAGVDQDFPHTRCGTTCSVVHAQRFDLRETTTNDTASAWRLQMAHIGDSPIVVGQCRRDPTPPADAGGGVAGVCVRLLYRSRDHKPEDPDEFNRITRGGGLIRDGRVGAVNISRTFGNATLRPHVNVEPEVKTIVLAPCQCCDDGAAREDGLWTTFVLVCSDGIYEAPAMSSARGSSVSLTVEGLASTVAERLLSPEYASGSLTSADVAQEVCDMAVFRHASEDNVTCALLVLPHGGGGAGAWQSGRGCAAPVLDTTTTLRGLLTVDDRTWFTPATPAGEMAALDFAPVDGLAQGGTTPWSPESGRRICDRFVAWGKRVRAAEWTVPLLETQRDANAESDVCPVTWVVDRKRASCVATAQTPALPWPLDPPATPPDHHTPHRPTTALRAHYSGLQLARQASLRAGLSNGVPPEVQAEAERMWGAAASAQRFTQLIYEDHTRRARGRVEPPSDPTEVGHADRYRAWVAWVVDNVHKGTQSLTARTATDNAFLTHLRGLVALIAPLPGPVSDHHAPQPAADTPASPPPVAQEPPVRARLRSPPAHVLAGMELNEDRATSPPPPKYRAVVAVRGDPYHGSMP